MVDLLGAAWFLWALFFAAVLSQIIYIICKKNIILFVSATTLVYLYGYYNMTTGNRLPYRSDIALFVQGFYGLGFAIKKLMVGKEIKTSNKYIFFQTSLAIVTSLNMYLMKTFLQGKALMDIANRWVSNPGWGTFAALNGIIWLSVISQLISKINNVKIKKIFLIVGRSTMGIMLLHFAFFRIVSFVLAIVGVVSIEECQNLVPSTEIGNRYWWIYYLSAIVGSIFVWNKSISIPGLKQLLGFDREFTRSIAQLRPIREMFEIYNDVGRGMRGAGNQLKSMMREQTAGNVFRKVALVGVLMILIASRYVPSYDVYARASDTQGTEDYNDNIIESKEITFPYNGNAVWFEEGWLEQTKDEQYRWVSKESEFSIELSNQTNIKMIGYIPNEIVGMNKVELYLNNNLIAEQKALAGQEIIIEVDISDKEIQGKNTFKLCFDGERNPAPDDADQRIFSAMFTSILVE